MAGIVHLWAFLMRGAPQMGEGVLVVSVVTASTIVFMWSIRVIQSPILVIITVALLAAVMTWFFGSLLLTL
jgi:hypothetical protein